MSKFLLNFLVQICKALVNSKIQFLIQKYFFFTLGPGTLTGPAGPAGPSPPASQSQLYRPKPLGSRAPLVYLQKYVFFFDSRLPFSAPSLYPPADTWAPLVGFVFSTAPADPGRVSTPPATSFNSHSSPPLLQPPLRRPPPAL
jgi:hypothetical protein